MDDERLKNPDGRPDYFDEMLERIRDIRASEKRFYQKVRDLFALSSDYDKTDKATQAFFATVQNLLLFAVTRKTAAELIIARANPADPHFGLLHWKGDKVRKPDIVVAKNYLTEDEIDTLNRLVVIFLETAELRAKSRQETRMAFWKQNVDQIITSNGFPLLTHAGSISHEQMEPSTQRYISITTSAAKSEKRRSRPARRGRPQGAGNQNQTPPEEMTDAWRSARRRSAWKPSMRSGSSSSKRSRVGGPARPVPQRAWVSHYFPRRISTKWRHRARRAWIAPVGKRVVPQNGLLLGDAELARAGSRPTRLSWSRDRRAFPRRNSRLDAIRVHAVGDQCFAHGSGAFFAQRAVVFAGAAFIGKPATISRCPASSAKSRHRPHFARPPPTRPRSCRTRNAPARTGLSTRSGP